VRLIEDSAPSIVQAQQRRALMSDALAIANAVEEAAAAVADQDGPSTLRETATSADGLLEQARAALVAAAGWRREQ
jgi:hypothetical protein